MLSKINLSTKQRGYVYLVALAVLPLLVHRGIVSSDESPLWVALVGTVLVPGLALRNLSNGPARRRRAGAEASRRAKDAGVL